MAATLQQKCAAEFLGTYILVLTIGCNVLGGSGTWAALSIASSLMVMVYALATVSGAAFNPAVALACELFAEKKDWSTMGIYMAVEVLGGIAAGFTYKAIHGDAFNLAPGAGFSYGGAGLIEVLYTFMLCFVVLRSAVDGKTKNPEAFGLAIGFVIVAGGYGAGWVSGGAFNPAVAIGLDVASHGAGVFWCLPYTLFEFVGAGLAAAVAKQLQSCEQGKQPKDSVANQFISEFLGTFFLVFTVGLNVLGGSPAAALSIAASLMCMIYALGEFGAHFNPAVTTALTIANKHEAKDVPVYMGAQVLGGLTAGIAYSSVAGKAFALAPVGNHSWGAVGFAEIVYTFVLCFVILNVAGSAKGNGKLDILYGFAIGFCIVVGGYAIGGVSGGSLNPAVSIGIDTADAIKGGKWSNCLAYSAFEFMGAAFAALAYSVIKPNEVKKVR